MDEDVEQMSREQLVTEVKRLRQGIRQHRDCTGHELCWHQCGRYCRTRPTRCPQYRTGCCLAGVHTIPAVARCASAGCPRTSESFGGERVAPNLLHQFTAHSAAATAAATPTRKTSSRCLSP